MRCCFRPAAGGGVATPARRQRRLHDVRHDDGDRDHDGERRGARRLVDHRLRHLPDVRGAVRADADRGREADVAAHAEGGAQRGVHGVRPALRRAEARGRRERRLPPDPRHAGGDRHRRRPAVADEGARRVGRLVRDAHLAGDHLAPRDGRRRRDRLARRHGGRRRDVACVREHVRRRADGVPPDDRRGVPAARRPGGVARRRRAGVHAGQPDVRRLRPGPAGGGTVGADARHRQPAAVVEHQVRPRHRRGADGARPAALLHRPPDVPVGRGGRLPRRGPAHRRHRAGLAGADAAARGVRRGAVRGVVDRRARLDGRRDRLPRAGADDPRVRLHLPTGLLQPAVDE